MSQTHLASTLEPEFKQSTFLQQSATYLHTEPHSDWIFNVSHHFRLAHQWLAFRLSGKWHCIIS